MNIRKLQDFISTECPEVQRYDESTPDFAIRIMRKLQAENAELREELVSLCRVHCHKCPTDSDCRYYKTTEQ